MSFASIHGKKPKMNGFFWPFRRTRGISWKIWEKRNQLQLKGRCGSVWIQAIPGHWDCEALPQIITGKIGRVADKKLRGKLNCEVHQFCDQIPFGLLPCPPPQPQFWGRHPSVTGVRSFFNVWPKKLTETRNTTSKSDKGSGNFYTNKTSGPSQFTSKESNNH